MKLLDKEMKIQGKVMSKGKDWIFYLVFMVKVTKNNNILS
jgi:hypothetical protein